MKLGLNAEQKAAIKKAQLKRLESLMELKAEHKEEMAKEDAEDMMKINADFKEDMRDILENSQYAKWETMHDDQIACLLVFLIGSVIVI